MREIVGCACAGPGTFSPPTWVSDPDMHHGTCVTHVPWCMSGSLTSRWRGKHPRHSRRMCKPLFYVSGKRPMLKWFSLTAQLVRGVSMGTRRWSCDGRIPNVTLHMSRSSLGSSFMGLRCVKIKWCMHCRDDYFMCSIDCLLFISLIAPQFGEEAPKQNYWGVQTVRYPNPRNILYSS